MSKYIDADKLIAEIKIIQQSLENRDVRFNQVKKIRTECSIEFCKCIIDVIDSLQQEQPEVELEKDIELYTRELPGTHSVNDGRMWWKGTYETLECFAREIFGLGLKARKED